MGTTREEAESSACGTRAPVRRVDLKGRGGLWLGGAEGAGRILAGKEKGKHWVEKKERTRTRSRRWKEAEGRMGGGAIAYREWGCKGKTN